MIKKIIKGLFCRHQNIECISNIYGDWINYLDCRSVWKCKNCGKIIKKSKLDKDCEIINFN